MFFFFFTRQNVRPRKIEPVSEVLYARARPISTERAICSGLNISRKKENQTMKFGQLIEYNMRNIFLEKSYTKRGEETIPRIFFNASKLSISLDQSSKVLCSLFFNVC